MITYRFWMTSHWPTWMCWTIMGRPLALCWRRSTTVLPHLVQLTSANTSITPPLSCLSSLPPSHSHCSLYCEYVSPSPITHAPLTPCTTHTTHPLRKETDKTMAVCPTLPSSVHKRTVTEDHMTSCDQFATLISVNSALTTSCDSSTDWMQ